MTQKEVERKAKELRSLIREVDKEADKIRKEADKKIAAYFKDIDSLREHCNHNKSNNCMFGWECDICGENDF